MSNESSSSAAMLPAELTLIVAATRNMGIGRGGTLPWTGLKKEMAYFARVTKRLVPPPPSAAAAAAAAATTTTTTTTAMNAVIMGRKTWDSIPPRFRPLKGRVNIVVSRSHHDEQPGPEPQPEEGPVRVSSLEQALAYLKASESAAAKISRAYVIGGAQIYGAALALPEARRVLLTRVLTDFECDTFFPLKLDESSPSPKNGWARRLKEELDAWTGETVPEGVQEENGTRYEFEMWERVD